MTLLDALRNQRYFGGLAAFRDLGTWAAWLTFLRAVYGLPLETDDEHVRFARHTGRQAYAPPQGGWREVVAVVGRQSGKTRIAATLAGFEAARAVAEPDGTERYAVMVAQDHRGAMRSLLRYATAPFERVPALAAGVTARTQETLALDNGVVLAAYPCRPGAVRGLRAVVACIDELAFFRTAEGNPVDAEMLRAVRPTLATTGGKLVILSSPYGQAGALWDLHRRHWGRADSDTLVWQASAPEMNPTLPADYLARMQADDPEAYRSEVLGEFRAGVAALLDPEAVAACVAVGVRERAPDPGRRYVAFADPSGGRGDRFALALAHAEGDVAVLDVLRAWAPPFNPSGVIAEAVDLLRRYGGREVVGDRYAAEFVAEGFRAHGITYRPAERDRSGLYLELLPRLNARRVALLDLPDLLRELRALERHCGPSGRDRVDHPRGGHDDLANAAAGACLAAAGAPAPALQIYVGQARPPDAGWRPVDAVAALFARGE
jgi:hypothetical protein